MVVTVPEFQIVEQRADYPGCCNVTGTAEGPFVQTDLFIAYDGRFCPTVELVERLGKSVGMIPKGEFDMVVARMAQLEAERDEALALKDEYERLRICVAETLKHGAVNNNGRIVLRSKPGVKRAEVE